MRAEVEEMTYGLFFESEEDTTYEPVPEKAFELVCRFRVVLADGGDRWVASSDPMYDVDENEAVIVLKKEDN